MTDAIAGIDRALVSLHRAFAAARAEDIHRAADELSAALAWLSSRDAMPSSASESRRLDALRSRLTGLRGAALLAGDRLNAVDHRAA